jgi:NADH-quinone oxidoreductase subunit M
MISHGLISGLMFMCVGVIYNTAHTRMVGDLSGLADRMPVTAGVFVAAAFGYMGLPLMSGFAGEFFVFLGSFHSTVLDSAPLFTAASMFGIVIVAGYLLYAMQRSLFGEFYSAEDYEIGPAARHDVVPLVVLLLAIITLGTAPELFYEHIEGAVVDLTQSGGPEALHRAVALLGGGA